MCGVGVVVVVVVGGSVGNVFVVLLLVVMVPTENSNTLKPTSTLSCVVDDTKEGLLRLFQMLEKFETFENVEEPLLSLNLAICG